MDQYAPTELPLIVLRAAQRWPGITSKPIHSKSSTWHWAFLAVSKQHKGNETRTFCPSPTGENNSDRLFPTNGSGFTITPFIQNRALQLHNCPFKGYSMGGNDRKTQNNNFFIPSFTNPSWAAFGAVLNRMNQIKHRNIYRGTKLPREQNHIGNFI